jgi:hypothetical protein
MRLEIRNVGKLREVDVDIRPLTVFVGRNGTNKTWAAHLLYSLLRPLRAQDAGLWGDHRVGAPLVVLPAAVEAKITACAAKLVDWAAGVGGGDEAFEIQRADLAGASEQHMEVQSTAGMLSLALGLGERTLASDASARLVLDGAEAGSRAMSTQIRVDQNGGFEAIAADALGTSVNRVATKPGPGNDDRQELFREMLCRMFFALAPDVLAFPTERAFLAMLPDAGIKRFGNLPMAVMDYPKLLLGQRFRVVDAAQQGVMDPPDGHDAVAKILGGWLSLPGGLIEQKATFSTTRDPAVGMPAASSLVRSLSGLYSYVEAGARPGDVVIVDEPEMNAHPEKQVELVELFARLANRGVRVVLITHSPYVLDHLTTLVEASAVPDERKQALAMKFQSQDPLAFLSPDDVAVYEFQDRGGEVEAVSRVDRAERTIEWSTFSDVSNEISRRYVDVVECGRRK